MLVLRRLTENNHFGLQSNTVIPNSNARIYHKVSSDPTSVMRNENGKQITIQIDINMTAFTLVLTVAPEYGPPHYDATRI